ncbi:MAG TPA: FAD-binding protein [Candidatus Bathyarchaeia archaeon]|nr:FAD-binding protein [Candidatus Bathyarchaeia archaeon]
MEKLKRYIIGSNASIFQKIDPDTNIEVFTPQNDEEIKLAIDFAKQRNLPITSKGGGSGLSGACTGASRDKVVISSMRLKKVHELNFEKGYAIVEPGMTPDELNEIIEKERPDWKFFVAPSSRDIATLGGILNTDGGGNDTWLAGTMVDNVLEIELIDYNNNIITIEKLDNDVSKAKITCNDKKLEKQLQDKNFSLIDIASSHGVLGFVSKMKVLIKPKAKVDGVKFALVHANGMKAFGEIIHQMIERNIPVTYGESIVEARHPEISGQTHPPMFILEYPTKFDEQIQVICKESEHVDYESINKEEFERMKDIRVKMAKRNPPNAYQIALFEGYGIYGENLLRYDEIIATINEKLRKHTFEPFIKFGHAPSVWYDEGKKIKGIIMHSREKRPDKLTPKTVFDAIVELVKTCEELGVTPKPEHKWPFSKNTQKHARLVELTEILGKKFNPFILDCKLEELADLVL